MEVENGDGLTLYRFRHLAAFPQLRHGVSTRRGGRSLPPFDSLNLSRSVGDAAGRVAANRGRVLAHFPGATPVFLRRVHGSAVAVLDGEGLPPDGCLAGEADAVVTRRTGFLLTILVADCQPVMLFDPVQQVVANVHSGWRGSVADIIGCTVGTMRMRFGCRPADIRAGIGPSLGPCCAEFIHFREEIPAPLWSYRTTEHHFDFWTLSRDQLLAAGLRPENIEIGGICTRCRADLFFSYRAARRTGRMAGLIGLVPSE